jgi:serine/threonine protein kinase
VGPAPVASPDATRLAADPKGTGAPEDLRLTLLAAPEGAWSPPALPFEFGRYQLLRLLGQGGMGAVYLARDRNLERDVAIKIPTFDHQTAEHKPRFLREARAAATLHHPNLCPVHDVGEWHGVPYMTMAYIQGRPLSDFIRPGQPLPTKQVAQIVRQLALAMAEAHNQGVVHRDLKPGNILIDVRKQPIIMDFGLARIDPRPGEWSSSHPAAQDARLTQAGKILGTPLYMSPEQVRGEPSAIGPRTDIYSLGVILYELLTGRPPFRGSLAEVLPKILDADPPSPRRFRTDIDPILSNICLRALAKKPADRFPTMQHFAQALSDYLAVEKAGRNTPSPGPKPGLLEVEVEPYKFNQEAPTALEPAPPPSSVRIRRGSRLAQGTPTWIVWLGGLAVVVAAVAVIMHLVRWLGSASGR